MLQIIWYLGADVEAHAGNAVVHGCEIRNETPAHSQTSVSMAPNPSFLPLRSKAMMPSSEFYFDEVLRPEAGQADVYQVAVAPVVEDVLSGYNGTVLAYGQTGADPMKLLDLQQNLS